MWIKAEDGTLVNMDRVDTVWLEAKHTTPSSVVGGPYTQYNIRTKDVTISSFFSRPDAKATLAKLGALLGAAEIPTLAEEPEAAEVLQTSAKTALSNHAKPEANELDYAIKRFAKTRQGSAEEFDMLKRVSTRAVSLINQLRQEGVL